MFLSLLVFCMPVVAHAENTPPDELIKTTVRDVLEIINHDKQGAGSNNKKLLDFIDARVLPHFDFDRMTKLAVGKAWRSATPEQKILLVQFGK